MIIKKYWVGKVAQSVKCLTCQQEDLSSNLRTHLKGKNTVTHAYNTAAEEVKDVDSGASITNLTNQSR